MNELQQVLLIFAVVVIAALYFLSKSRQVTTPKKSEQTTRTAQQKVKTSSESSESEIAYEKASDALNNLGNPHIPLSESTEKRLTESHAHYSEQSSSPAHNGLNDVHESEALFNKNQGVLSFGEEFDLPENTQSNDSQNGSKISDVAISLDETNSHNVETRSDLEIKESGKHHVLVVDDPGMTGEVDEELTSSDYVKPSFGIPAEDTKYRKPLSSTNKEPEVFVILVMSTGQEFAMQDVNQALLGVGLSYSEQAFFVKKDNMGNDFIKVANMLEPGTFPQENLANYATPGVAMILELPSTVRAPAAMHDLIMMARKVSQRLNGRLYDMERHLIKESDLQSMRDAALDYESEPIA